VKRRSGKSGPNVSIFRRRVLIPDNRNRPHWVRSCISVGRAPGGFRSAPFRHQCTRVSTEYGLDQEFNSLDAQREAAEAYVRSQAHDGWTLIRTRYDDGGYSGGSTERPALQRLLADIRDRRALRNFGITAGTGKAPSFHSPAAVGIKPGRNYPRAPPDQRNRRSATQDCSVTSPNGN
jgi:Resolvase, N terminal domain